MSRLDVVIFGASGFTGKYTVIEMVRLAKKHGLSWGVAGRSQPKLDTLISETAKKTGEDLRSVKVIIADVNDEKSLKEMCGQAKVLVNCCGPYRLYGEQVVRAAINSHTHHIDVSGEPHFIESMQLNWDKAAKDAGVYVISACGFDSIPADMGILYLQEHFRGTLNSVESYVSTSLPPELRAEAKRYGTIHTGTWESLVHSLNPAYKLKPLRQKLYPEKLPTPKYKLAKRCVLHKRFGQWYLPFMGSDESVVYRSQRALSSHPLQMRAYVRLDSWLQAVLQLFGLTLLLALAQFKWTRQLVLSYPRVFSAGRVNPAGPTEAVIKATGFTFDLYGEGWDQGTDQSKPPNKKVAARVTGVDPGYGATVSCLLMSAITILKEHDKMPATGGVLTTAVAFKNTNLINSLIEENVNFEIIQDKSQKS